MREFRDYLFALQENLQFETLADIAQDFISLRDVEPLAFSITRAGRVVAEPLSQVDEDDLTTFDAAPVAVMPAFVRPKVSLREPVDSGASTLNAQGSLVTTQQSIVSSQQLAPASQQLIGIGQQPLITEEFIKLRDVQLETLAEPEPFQSAKFDDEASMIPPSLFQETELQSAPVTAPTELKPSLSLSNLQTVLPTVLQPTELTRIQPTDLQSVSSSSDNLQLGDFDELAMKDNASFQLSERNAYDIQEGDSEQNSLVNQITNQTLFISNNEKRVKLPFANSAAFSPKQSFTFDDDSGEPRQSVTDRLDNQSVNNPIVNAQGSANISLKAISESAALRAIAIIEESLSQELEGRLA